MGIFVTRAEMVNEGRGWLVFWRDGTGEVGPGGSLLSVRSPAGGRRSRITSQRRGELDGCGSGQARATAKQGRWRRAVPTSAGSSCACAGRRFSVRSLPRGRASFGGRWGPRRGRRRPRRGFPPVDRTEPRGRICRRRCRLRRAAATVTLIVVRARGSPSSHHGRRRIRRERTTCTGWGRRPITWTSRSGRSKASLMTCSWGISSEGTVSRSTASFSFLVLFRRNSLVRMREFSLLAFSQRISSLITGRKQRGRFNISREIITSHQRLWSVWNLVSFRWNGYSAHADRLLYTVYRSKLTELLWPSFLIFGHLLPLAHTTKQSR